MFDKTLIRQNPRVYPLHQREWVKRYCEKQVYMGVYQRIKHHLKPDPVFLFNSILVAKGQLQQEYRFCGNYVEANTCIYKLAALLPDCTTIVDALQGCTYMTIVDIQSGI